MGYSHLEDSAYEELEVALKRVRVLEGALRRVISAMDRHPRESVVGTTVVDHARRVLEELS